MWMLSDDEVIENLIIDEMAKLNEKYKVSDISEFDKIFGSDDKQKLANRRNIERM
eukprot:CAMPEP_0196801710 /NCGR_PEP_ID=MMETSP1362-20130617/1486_1 /TAXON_ID=163516 /ORGANISM="Leptocylindrus danicus, Strain CCMP1856" /LENGTH=54 /DNA_ID=CAMNT_0042172795 /DNA_START=91 /DNA_END=255 /DNA_ORIENTATION=-